MFWRNTELTIITQKGANLFRRVRANIRAGITVSVLAIGWRVESQCEEAARSIDNDDVKGGGGGGGNTGGGGGQ